MDTPSEPSWDDIEAVLYQEWVEEQALLAVLEAMGQLNELDEAEFAEKEAEDEFLLGAFPLHVFPLDDRTWGDFSLNDIWVDGLSSRST